MEHRRIIVVILVGALCIVSGTEQLLAQDGAPSNEEMIRQRLRSDIEELKEENRSLRNELERLRGNRSTEESVGASKGGDGELRAENQRLRSMLRQYRRLIDDFVESARDIDTGVISSVDTGQEVVDDNNVEEAPEGEDEIEEESKWMNDPDRPYPIRTEPLEEEITYVTDSDDTLSKLAHQFYHDAELWIRIYLINEDRLNSPDSLPPGTELRLPPLDRIDQ